MRLAVEMTRTRGSGQGDYTGQSARTYQALKGDLQKVLMLPLEGEKGTFRDFLVGYLMVEHDYSQTRAAQLVAGNEAAILMMLTEEHPAGLW
jgi:hypothetical protein